MAVRIGFDFGTCFSSAFFLHGGQYMPLVSRAELPTRGRVPSAYYQKPGEGGFAGTPAVRRGLAHPEFLSLYVKRRYRARRIRLGGTAYTPAEIVREIVRYLMEGVREALREQYRIEDSEIEAVVTVPVRYGEQWQEMLLSAMEEAGIRVQGVLREPAAAAVCFYESAERRPGRVLVYDLGGGTADIALLRAVPDEPHRYEVLGQEGDEIGGTDWDERLCEFLAEQLTEQAMSENPALAEEEAEHIPEQNRRKLLQIARLMKEALSAAETAEETVELQGESYTLRVTRAEFEELTQDLLGRTVAALHRLTGRCGDFDEMVLAGGGSRMPQVMARMQAEFPGKKISLRQPEFAAAIGAAICAGGTGTVMQIAPHSYGLLYQGSKGERLRNLIFRGEKLPVSGRCEWVLPGQNVRFMLYEGSHTERGTGEDVPLINEVYAVSATVWLAEPPAEQTRCYAELTLDRHGRLHLVLLDGESNLLGEAEIGI